MASTDWPMVPISELQSSKRWALNGGPFGSKLVSRDYVESGVPVIRGANLASEKRFNFQGFVFVTEEKADELLANNAHPGDVIFTQRGTLGQVGIIPKTSPFPRFVISQSQMKITVDDSRVDADWLFYNFRDPSTQQEMINRASSSGVPHINLGVLREFQLRLPPLHEQRRVASILSAYDDLIENNTRRIAVLEEMARRIYEEWFVRFRFPGHENVRMVESELGLVPDEWQVTTLGALVQVNARSVRRGKEPTAIRYVDISSVSTGSIDKQEPMLFADAPGRARRIVRDGDVIWACVRPNRKSYSLVLNPEPNLLVSTGFAVLSPVAAPWSFVYQLIITDDFVSYLVNNAKGAAYPAVGADEFNRAIVLKPQDSILTDFDNLAAPMMRLVNALQRKNANLRTTRNLLLPKLISGDLDVSALPDPEAAAA